MDESELEIFSLLHASGVPFFDNIRLSFRNSDQIYEALNQGIPFADLLSRQHEGHMRQLGTLLGYFSLDQAIVYDEKLRQSRKLLVSRLLKGSAYPLFIMAFASALTWFFSLVILPAFERFQSGNILLLEVLKAGSLFFWGLVGLFALFLGLVFFNPSSRHLSFLLFRLPIVRMVASLECAALLECTQKSGLSTRDTLDFFRQSRSFPFASLMAAGWSAQLKKGVSFYACLQRDPRLDPAFVRFLEIGLSGSLNAKMMEAYQKSTLLRLEKTVQKLSSATLMAAYGCVGILALCVYQIMLAPLDILEAL